MKGDSPEATRLRNVLVDRLVREGRVRDVKIEAAFRAVPRHLFVPKVSLREAYSDRAIVTKQVEGQPISSISQPSMIAIMLDQLGLRSGQRVLEIGAGTGYAAALMAHIVGKGGQVITMDIDEDLVAGARAHLSAAGCDEHVQVVCGDGAGGWPDGAPYDRIILAVGAADIAPAWREQLKPDGRVVLPLDLRNNGVQFSIAFDLADGHLVARSFQPCGFIRLRGALFQEQTESAAEITGGTDFGAAVLSAVAQLLPHVGDQLWRRHMNRQAFGRPTLEGLRLCAYPRESNYQASADEVVHDRRWTRFVVSWATP